MTVSFSSYRIKRGTKLADITPPPVPPLSSLNGPFQLAEFLALQVKHDPHNIQQLVQVPVGDATVGGKGPERDVWIYEHLRRIPIDLTPLLTLLLPVCTRESCPTMRSSEWSYFCIAHGNGTRECSTIDYILHTLDSTVALLNNSKHFPSRMQIPQASLSHFPHIFRRLSRIFSHAYFHHREAFILAESENSLYKRFVALCETYELVGERLLVIPRGVAGNDKGHDSTADHSEVDDEFDRGQSSPTKLPLKSSSPTADQSPFLSAPSKTRIAKGNNTLSRGKQPRTTMLWAKEAMGGNVHEKGQPAAPVETRNVETSENVADTISSKKGAPVDDMSVRHNRRESTSSTISSSSADSVQTAILNSDLETKEEAGSEGNAVIEHDINPSMADSSPLENDPSQGLEAEEQIPKDEIDLLEEQGKLDEESNVSPLIPPDEYEVGVEGEKGQEVKAESEEVVAEATLESPIGFASGSDTVESAATELISPTAPTELTQPKEATEGTEITNTQSSPRPNTKFEEVEAAQPTLPSISSAESDSGSNSGSPSEDFKKDSMSRKRAKKAAQKARAKERGRAEKAAAAEDKDEKDEKEKEE
nr:hypothetical protein L203_02123 [Cryptococcus depauperatus CBS 7841]